MNRSFKAFRLTSIRCSLESSRRAKPSAIAVDRELVVVDDDRYRISLRAIADEERTRWNDNARVKFFVENQPWMLASAKSAVELKTRSPHDFNELTDEAEDLYALLGLLDARLSYGLWAPFGQLKKWGQADSDFYFFGFIETRPPTQIEYGAMLGISDEQTFRRYWSLIVGSSDQNRRLRRAIARFRRARSCWFAEDAILHSFIGLESIFGDHTKAGGKNTKKVTHRVSRFMFDPDVSPSAIELSDLSDRIANLYDFRHDIVHGALPDLARTVEAAKDSMSLLQTAILIALEEGLERTADLVALAKRYETDLREAQRSEKRRVRQSKKRDQAAALCAHRL